MLQDLQEKYGLTYLFISHQLQVVQKICDEIGVLYLGNLMEIADADKLYSNPLHPYTKMLISSIQSIFSDEVKEIPSAIAIYVTIFSIVGKLMLASYQYKQGKKIDSSMLTANAINMRNDVVISAGVLLGLIFTFIFKLPILDSITGLIISLFIIKSSIGIFLDSNVELMDGVKDVNVYNKIFEAVEKVPGASNPHRVRSRMIGNRYIITLDIEVNPQITITQAHEIAGAVEKSIESSIDNVYDILVHVEPAGECQTDEKFGVDKDMV